jgi:hypothetical protein
MDFAVLLDRDGAVAIELDLVLPLFAFRERVDPFALHRLNKKKLCRLFLHLS